MNFAKLYEDLRSFDDVQLIPVQSVIEILRIGEKQESDKKKDKVEVFLDEIENHEKELSIINKGSNTFIPLAEITKYLKLHEYIEIGVAKLILPEKIFSKNFRNKNLKKQREISEILAAREGYLEGDINKKMTRKLRKECNKLHAYYVEFIIPQIIKVCKSEIISLSKIYKDFGYKNEYEMLDSIQIEQKDYFGGLKAIKIIEDMDGNHYIFKNQYKILLKAQKSTKSKVPLFKQEKNHNDFVDSVENVIEKYKFPEKIIQEAINNKRVWSSRKHRFFDISCLRAEKEEIVYIPETEALLAEIDLVEIDGPDDSFISLDQAKKELEKGSWETIEILIKNKFPLFFQDPKKDIFIKKEDLENYTDNSFNILILIGLVIVAGYLLSKFFLK